MTKPFIKWKGGKSKLLSQIAPHLPTEFNDYYEPFLGSGAMYYYMYDFGMIENQAFLSDINTELITTYRVIRNQPEKLIRLLKQYKKYHDKKFYYVWRDIIPVSDLGIAARFIYLNKTCFNGIYRVNSKGKFNVPMGRYNNPVICDERVIQECSAALQNVELSYCDFSRISPTEGDFVYCDPPYYGTDDKYSCKSFDEASHNMLKRFADSWNNRGVKFIIHNSDTPFVRKLYRVYNLVNLQRSGSVNSDPSKRHKVTEILIKNF